MRLSLLLVGLAGCADWPRFANSVEQGDLVEYVPGSGGFAWNDVTEGAGNNDTPLTALRGPLAVDSGYLFEGSLDATGFDPELTPQPLTDPVCASTGVRTAVDGDYTGDVDSYGFLAKAAGTLCVVATWQGDVTVDVLGFPVDDCSVPSAPVGGPPPNGLGASGGAASWSAPVTEGSRMAVQFAGTTAGTTAVPYRLGVALVAADGACPESLPE